MGNKNTQKGIQDAIERASSFFDLGVARCLLTFACGFF